MPGGPVSWVGRRLLRSRFHPLYLRLSGQRDFVAEYRRFVELSEQAAGAVGDTSVRVSVLMPAHNPNPRWVAEAVESVRGQSYPNWELCICDDASDVPFEPAPDQRIRVVRTAQRVGISAALNRARELASGELLCFLDHDDVLSPVALQCLVEAGAALVYSDEDYVDERGRPVRPHRKPDWSPELLSNCMYVGHLMAVSARLFDEVGGFRREYDGAQDYDLALRLTEREANVAHAPRILYHWREHTGSIAHNVGSKPYSHVAGRRALEDAVRRRGWNAEVLDDRIPNQYRLRRPAAPRNAVQLVAPGVKLPGGGKFIVFLDPNLRPENHDWLDWITAQLQRPEVGVAGARILAPDGADEDADAQIAAEMPAPGLRHPVYWKWLSFTRNVESVNPACLGVRRELFEKLGRATGRELCRRARAEGLQVILEANAVLRRMA